MIELFSRYRSELMGLATVMVLLGHTVFYSNGAVSYGFLTDIVTLGYSGVEIFLFCPDLACTFLWRKRIIRKHFTNAD